MKNISAKPDGLEIEFTQPADKALLQNAGNYEINSFTYKYHHSYGSPIINNEKCPVQGIVVSEDGKKVRLVLGNLRPGYIHEVKLTNLTAQSGAGLLHNFGYYTLNNIPAGEKAQLTESQKVMPHAHEMTPATPPASKKNKKEKLKNSTKTAQNKHQTIQPAELGTTRPGTDPGNQARTEI